MFAVSSAPTTAHDFWLHPEKFRIQPGEVTVVVPMIGHGADRQRWGADPRRIVEIHSLSRLGRQDHYPSAVPVRRGESIRLHFRQSGVHVLGLATDYARSELPPQRFTDYLEAEGLTPIAADRRLRGEEARPGREIYSRCAKVVLEVGGAGIGDTSVTRPMGLKLEIVPEADPRQSTAPTPLRIYYEGKPLGGALVKLWRLGNDSGPQEALRTGRDGRVQMAARGPGAWQLNVVWSKRLEHHPWADFETTFSSLTFSTIPN